MTADLDALDAYQRLPMPDPLRALAAKLLPCPFCGHAARLDDREGRSPFVACTYCQTTSAQYSLASGAVAAWDTRAALASAPERETLARALYEDCWREGNGPTWENSPHQILWLTQVDRLLPRLARGAAEPSEADTPGYYGRHPFHRAAGGPVSAPERDRLAETIREAARYVTRVASEMNVENLTSQTNYRGALRLAKDCEAAAAALRATPSEPSETPEAALLRRFTDVMREKLEENTYKSSWREMTTSSLMRRLIQETEELALALIVFARTGDPFEVTREAADVANFAAMIADVADRAATVRAKEVSDA